MWQRVAKGNIQQIGYIPQMEQYSPFWLMLFFFVLFLLFCFFSVIITNCTLCVDCQLGKDLCS